MSAYAPNNGWACRDCGHFNEPDSYNCDECMMDQVEKEQRRWEKTRERWQVRDKILLRSVSGTLYRVRRWRRNILTYTVLVPGGYTYRVERYRAPSSVVRQAVEHFFNVKLG